MPTAAFPFPKNSGLIRPNSNESKDDDALYYWQVWHHNWDDHDIELFKKHLSGTENVLEVGCGDGRVAFGLADHCKEILAVDIDKRFIAQAETNLKAKNAPANLRFAVMDAEALDLPSASVDIAIYSWVLHMVTDRSATVREAHRVLKPGGKAIFIGIHSDCDYDRIIAPFIDPAIAPQIPIDPKTIYADPIEACFGSAIETTARECFPYTFENIGIAADAFAQTMGKYYAVKMDRDKERQLKEILGRYKTLPPGEKIAISFYASLYIAQRIS